jgi:dual-action HEIGH metallo-peptidase
MFVKTMVLAVSLGALTFGCSTEPPRDGADRTQEIVDNLVQAGYPSTDIMVVDGKVFVGNDAEVSLQASQEMLEVDASAASKEQYRTTNLVSSSVRTICVNGAAFTGVFSTALNNAIANYNGQNLSFHMTRTSGSTTGCNAVITGRISGPAGGSSGFPSGGQPFNTINIGGGLSTFAVGTVTHVITHELGHCIGFRHSDFFNRAISCGGAASNEGTAGVGATLIPGTPSGATVGGSIMNACFRTSETGKFTSSDITALQFLY